MVTLSTIIYEGNFKTFFDETKWFWIFNSDLISKKQIIVNNLSSREEFLEKCDKWKLKHQFEFLFVDDFYDDVIKKFNINLDRNNIGYVYSIPYYVSFINCNTEYILNVATDCMDTIFVDDNFISESINLLDNNSNCLTTTIPWIPGNSLINGKTCGENEMIHYNLENYKDGHFLPNFGFSDQVFLSKTELLKSINYNVPNTGKYHGPYYCNGICFEMKIVDYSWLNKKFRFVYDKNCYYKHN